MARLQLFPRRPRIERSAPHAGALDPAVDLWRDGTVANLAAALHPDGPVFESPDLPPGAVFEIGSLTKGFTGILLAEAIARGELAEKTRLGEVLGDLSGPAAEATMLQLATHTAGLPRLLPGVTHPRHRADPYARYDEARLLEETAKVQPQASGYSNLGFALLGLAVARASGRTYRALVEERIAAPLALHDTAIDRTPIPGHTAKGRPTPRWTMNAWAGAGAVCSTPGDMRRLAAAILDPPPGPLGDAIALATTKRLDTEEGAIGYGWRIGAPDRPRLVWHNGGTGGFSVYFAVDRALGRGVVLLADTSCGTALDDAGLAALRA